MDFTNKLNFPQYIADWLAHDDYDHNYDPYTVSATTLMKPIRATLLTQRYHEHLEKDVVDFIASKVGTAIHDSIENITTENVTKEVREERLVTTSSGQPYKVTGKFDVLVKEDDGTYTLRDIKTTSVWAYIYGGKDKDYIEQLSIYRWLLSQNFNVNITGYIDFFFTDWQSSKAKNEHTYPQHRVSPSYAVQLKSLEETEAWIMSRVVEIEAQREVEDNKLPYCTKEELWATDEVFAVYKTDAKRATKLCDSLEEAQAYKQNKKIVGMIQKRSSKMRRCNYCPALPFCNQGQTYANKNLLA
jgi:Txe/YoeB family toxin of Txe-Axe toxin-antitoxin module